MSDEPHKVNMEKEMVSKVAFYDDLGRLFDQLILRKLRWTKKVISEVLDMLHDNRLPNAYRSKSRNVYEITSLNRNAKGETQDDLELVSDKKYYEVLCEVHIATNHGTFEVMTAHLKEKNLLIPTPPFMTFLRMCKLCQDMNPGEKVSRKPMKIQEKLILFNLIDMREMPSDQFKWILHYRDLSLAYSLLRPLKTTAPGEIATVLLNIFADNGCPTMIHCDGNIVIGKVFAEMIKLWPLSGQIKIQRCKKSAINKIAQDITGLVEDWVDESGNNNWSSGVYFLQYKVNYVFNASMKVEPIIGPEEELDEDEDIAADDSDENSNDA